MELESAVVPVVLKDPVHRCQNYHIIPKSGKYWKYRHVECMGQSEIDSEFLVDTDKGVRIFSV